MTPRHRGTGCKQSLSGCKVFSSAATSHRDLSWINTGERRRARSLVGPNIRGLSAPANRFKSDRKRARLPVSSIFIRGPSARRRFAPRVRGAFMSSKWSAARSTTCPLQRGERCLPAVMRRESAHRCVSTRPFTTPFRPLAPPSSFLRRSGAPEIADKFPPSSVDNFTRRCKRRSPFDNGLSSRVWTR